MIEPIVLEFDVDAVREHAFDVWTARAGMWWPRSHTMSRAEDLEVVFDPYPGGRVFERAGDGSEHVWGTVVEWDPPRRVSYTWHLFFEPEQATDITVTFEPRGEGTRVRLVQTGFDRLGPDVGAGRRDRTGAVWASIAPRFAEASARG